MSFDLLTVPDGFQTDLALVVAPYVDPKFMSKLVAQMRPKRLCLLVDDGVRLEDLDKIRSACRRNVKLEVRLGRASALVHMKAFYFEFLRDEIPRRRKRRLLFGSANATNAAFLGSKNAELIADVNLAISEDAGLADYFEKILEAFDTDDVVDIKAQNIWLSKSPVLYLPRFKSVVPGALPSGFDTWLQRGVLAAQYRNSPQFMTLSIQLKQALPQDLVATIFANRSFRERGGRNIVRYGYMNGVEEILGDEESERPRWKSRYCVWTQLGDWLSDECYRKHNDILKSKAADARTSKVTELLNNADDIVWKESRRSEFLAALAQVWDDLRVSGVDPRKYLESKSNSLCSAVYADRFDQKISQDILLAQDEEFRQRYINGYEFPDIPRFRQDTAAWESFVRSWSESIAVEAAKARTLSLVTRRISDSMAKEGLVLASMAGEEIVDYLRKNWTENVGDEDMSVGDWVVRYFE